ncbi:four-carbon acid sugar kinase family protein [Streptomyces rugosispiralis]|uniref:Four-carbon acid sugar kinase family protein n=1 Tax=Streptomyces rugosispiralis TaxID=2967341 RepID=A0ABT1UTA1_9ACTN|nr:four-carbon acid sugar kinase family protein [Streptomyces rugosispiralis]MCQ8188345.1 four-carbon acid sugar kinase family protein [Streptomyces rugosispiralis]
MTPSRRLLAIADDLSGAAEVAAAVRSRTTRSRVLLLGGPGTGGMATALRPRHVGEATVLDLDSRYRPAAEAAEAVRGALRMSWPDGTDGRDALDTIVLKKIDSLLRGNVAAEIAALAEDGTGVVLAPALPIAGRVVRSGVVHIGGVPLHEGDAWRAETVPPPASVAQALGGLPSALIPLTTVRSSRPTLLTALRAAAAAGRVAICDAETDADLDAIVGASLADGPGMRLVGSGGLALAVGRHLATTLPAAGARAAPGTPDPAAPAATGPATATAEGPTATTVKQGATAATGPAATAAGSPVTTAVGQTATGPTSAPGPAAAEAMGRGASDAPRAPALTSPSAAASTAGTAVSSTDTGAGPDAAAPSAHTGRPVLVVVGTAEPAAVEQVRRLVEDGAGHQRLPLAGLLADGPPVGLPALTADVTVVSLGASPGSADPAPAYQPVSLPSPRPAPPSVHGAEPVSGRRLVLGLARVVGAAVTAHRGAVDLVLTGGETARRVLDALAVTELDPIGQVHHGAVHLRAPDGRSVVTRPGSFGDPDSLRHIVQALRPHSTERKVTS